MHMHPGIGNGHMANGHGGGSSSSSSSSADDLFGGGPGADDYGAEEGGDDDLFDMSGMGGGGSAAGSGLNMGLGTSASASGALNIGIDASGDDAAMDDEILLSDAQSSGYRTDGGGAGAGGAGGAGAGGNNSQDGVVTVDAAGDFDDGVDEYDAKHNPSRGLFNTDIDHVDAELIYSLNNNTIRQRQDYGGVPSNPNGGIGGMGMGGMMGDGMGMGPSSYNFKYLAHWMCETDPMFSARDLEDGFMM